MSNKLPQEFIRHLISLVQKEMAIDQEATMKLLSGSTEVLEKRGVAILDLKVAAVAAGIGGTCNLVLEVASNSRKPQPIPKHKLTNSDFVALTEYDRYNDTNGGDFWSAIVVEVKKENITLSLDNSDDNERRNFLQLSHLTKLVKIVKLPNNITHERMLTTLTSMLAKKELPKLSKVLLGQVKLFYPHDINDLKIFNQSLNKHQKKAVKFALGSPHIALIHGPPGTGKTHTLVEIIRQLVDQKKKVLVCGPSHVSVDNLMERVVPHTTNVVRLGHPARVSPEVVGYTLDVLCCGGNSQKVLEAVRAELRRLSMKLRTPSAINVSEKSQMDETFKSLSKFFKKRASRKDTADVLSKADVVFSTLNGSGGSVMRYKKFDVVIIDEAAQATEPDCWVALTKGRKAILAGDHLQLPPTVITPPSKIVRSLTKNFKKPTGMSVFNDLSYTMFDRLLDMYGDRVKKFLSMQYRMHQKIMEFSSNELYGGKLVAHSSVKRHLLSDLPLISGTSNTLFPLIMIDTKDIGFSTEVKGTNFDKQSTANLLEVKLVVEHIKKLLKDGLCENQIGVITPYKAQVTKLRLEIGVKWLDIEIGTVDGFQGREKDAIILSLVRSNKNGEVGFLAEKRRLNVAMTRAKRSLIVVCDSETLNGSKMTMSSKKNKYRKKNINFVVDTTFIEKWMKWLGEESNIRLSKQQQQ